MKFKNYVNKFNHNNRILSEEDLLQMRLEQIFDQEPDIMSQNEDIGIPSYEELQMSPFAEWVAPFTNDMGESDGGYWQSKKDDLEVNLPLPSESPMFQLGVKKDVSVQPTENISEQISEQGQKKLSLPESLIFSPLQALPGNAIGYKLFNTLNKLISGSPKDLNSKYSGLSPLQAVQKAASKSPFGKSSEKQYYGISSHLADGEKPSKFMQEQNNFYKLGEITDPDLKNMYIKKAAAMYGLDPSSPDAYERVKNTDVVMPKPDSQLYNQIKNSETFQKWVAENYWKIKNNEDYETSITFPGALLDPDKRALYATIHRAGIQAKVKEDGSLLGGLGDGFDFEKWELKHYKDAKNLKDFFTTPFYNQIIRANNRAHNQQEAGQITNYILSTFLNLSKDEVEEILKKHGKLR